MDDSTLEINYPQAYLDSLPAYNCHAGVDSMLDLAREIIDSDGYYWQGVAFPTGSNILIPAQGTYVGNVSVEPLSYIIAITGYSNQPEGFKIRIYDKGAKADIIDKQFIYSTMLASNMQMLLGGTAYENVATGPYLLTSPLIILNPGSLQIEITNLSVSDAMIQIMLSCAFPVTDRSINIKDIKG